MEDYDTQQEHQNDEKEQFKPKGWSNAPLLSSLKADHDAAKTTHDQQATKIRVWLDNLNMEGSALLKDVPAGFSKIQPKLIRKQAEWRYAALSEPFLNTEDMFQVSPVTWEDVEPARQNALVLNNQFNTQIGKQKFIDEYVRACVDEGTAIVKLSWDYEDEEITGRRATWTFQPSEEVQPLLEELTSMQEENPTGYDAEVPAELKVAHKHYLETSIPVFAVQTGFEDFTETKVLKNQPCLEVCNYKNVIPDPACEGDLSRAQFVIHSFETTLSELKRAGIYKNLDRLNIQEGSALADPDHEVENEDAQDFQPKGKPRQRLVAYEYWGFWDYDGSGIAKPIVCTWVDGTIIRMEESPMPDGTLPFVFVQMLPVRRSLYGEPDGELLTDNQKVIGAITRGMVDIMGRSANGQMGFMKGALDAVNMRRYQKGQDYQFNGGTDPRLAMYQHQYPEIPNSAQWLLDQQQIEAESMTGVQAFNQGINSASLGQVATGIRQSIDAASKRETGILRRLVEGMKDIARKIISLNYEYLEDEEIIRITNEKFVRIRREDLGGKFDLKMDISTLEEDNAKAQELAFMLQTMGNNMDQGMAKLILRDIARLRKMPELAHAIENYEPQPDPIAQEIQMLERDKLLAEIEKIRSETVENYSDAALNEAKKAAEGAKARLNASQADKNNLDYVEQESGVTQERDKEKLAVQGETNKELEVVKAVLNNDGESATPRLADYLAGKEAA
jgi:hypothetical protein